MLFQVFLQRNITWIDLLAMRTWKLFVSVMRALVIVQMGQCYKLFVTLITLKWFRAALITKYMIFAIISAFEAFLANRALVTHRISAIFCRHYMRSYFIDFKRLYWCLCNNVIIGSILDIVVIWWYRIEIASMTIWCTICYELFFVLSTKRTAVLFFDETFSTLLMAANFNNYSAIRFIQISTTNTALLFRIAWAHFAIHIDAYSNWFTNRKLCDRLKLLRENENNVYKEFWQLIRWQLLWFITPRWGVPTARRKRFQLSLGSKCHCAL